MASLKEENVLSPPRTACATPLDLERLFMVATPPTLLRRDKEQTRDPFSPTVLFPVSPGSTFIFLTPITSPPTHLPPRVPRARSLRHMCRTLFKEDLESPPSPSLANFKESLFGSFAEALRQEIAASKLCAEKKAELALMRLHEEFGGNQKGMLSEGCQNWLDTAEAKAAEIILNKKKMLAEMTERCVVKNYSGTGSTFVCVECPSRFKFKTREGLSLHLRNKHSDNSKPWSCNAPRCQKTFARKTDLRVHLIRIHSETRPFRCGVPRCTKGFATSGELRRHFGKDHLMLLSILCEANPTNANKDFFCNITYAGDHAHSTVGDVEEEKKEYEL